jgi:hypothetical protein
MPVPRVIIMGLALSRPELPLSPGCRVGVVVHKDRYGNALLQGLTEWFVPPGQMRGEDHRGPIRGDKAGGSDTDSRDAPGSDDLHQLGNDLNDGVLDDRRALGAMRSVPACAMGDVAIDVDQTAGHLGATDVDTDGKPAAHG